MRKVYPKPSKEFEMFSDELLELLKSLYGLPDARDYWNQTMMLHFWNDLGMPQATSDISLFYKHVRDEIARITRSYVDGSLHVGTKDFMKLTEKSLQRFDSRDCLQH